MSLYTSAIDRLIPGASREATIRVRETGKKSEIRTGVDGNPVVHDFWSQYFHEAMNRRAAEHGLRSW